MYGQTHESGQGNYRYNMAGWQTEHQTAALPPVAPESHLA